MENAVKGYEVPLFRLLSRPKIVLAARLSRMRSEEIVGVENKAENGREF